MLCLLVLVYIAGGNLCVPPCSIGKVYKHVDLKCILHIISNKRVCCSSANGLS